MSDSLDQSIKKNRARYAISQNQSSRTEQPLTMSSLCNQGDRSYNQKDKEKQTNNVSRQDLQIKLKLEEQIKIEEEGIQRQTATENEGIVSKEPTMALNQIGLENIPNQSNPNEQGSNNLSRAELSDKETKSLIWMNGFQNALKNQFSLELFSSIAQQLNSHTSQSSKETISIEDIMKVSAFLLSTGIAKKSAISDYFEFSLGAPQLISKQLFANISSSLSKNASPLLFSSVFSQSYGQQTSQSESKLIRTNYLGLFEEFNIFFGQKSSYRRTNNKRFRVLQSPDEITDTRIPSRLPKGDHAQLKGLDSQSHGVHPFPSTYQTQLFQVDHIYCYNPKTLALCGVKEGKLLAEEEDNYEKSQIKQEDNSNIFSSFKSGPESELQLFYSPGKRTASGLFFENYFNLLDSQNQETFQLLQQKISITCNHPILLSITFFDCFYKNVLYCLKLIFLNKLIKNRIVCQSRPLRTIDLEEFECNGLRAFAESLYTLCVNIFSQINEYYGQPIPFKNILNKIIENLMERANQISLNNKFSSSEFSQSTSPLPSRVISIATQHHTFIKTKHCNFCIVCQKNGTYTKSKYSCVICQNQFRRCIALCMHNCDKLFHENPSAYLRGIEKVEQSQQQDRLKKKDNIIQEIPNILVSEYLEQLETYQKSISLLMKSFNVTKSIILEPVCLKSKPSKSKLIHKAEKARRDELFENAENLPFINLKLSEVESITLQFPPYVQTNPEIGQCKVDCIFKKSRKKVKLDSPHKGEGEKYSEESYKLQVDSEGSGREEVVEQEKPPDSGNEEEEEIQSEDEHNGGNKQKLKSKSSFSGS